MLYTGVLTGWEEGGSARNHIFKVSELQKIEIQHEAMETRKMRETKKRMLLAVDGTEESLAVVRYVSESLRPAGTEVTVYHIMSKVPEVFWDLGNDPVWLPQIAAIRGYEQRQEVQAAGLVKKAVALLQDAGFKAEHLTPRIETKKEGIARDILAEARRGYDVLVIGRGKVGAMTLGSVSSKILGSVSAPALWLVGRKPNASKILVAMDSSAYSLEAVRHAGKMFNRGKNSITLFHAIRGITVSAEGLEDIFPESYRQQLLEDAEREIHPAFKTAENILVDLDISPDRISTKIVTSVISRAEAVIIEAKNGGYGTIVTGRRGMSSVADFSMGRVTNKLIQLARDQSLCIVG